MDTYQSNKGAEGVIDSRDIKIKHKIKALLIQYKARELISKILESGETIKLNNSSTNKSIMIKTGKHTGSQKYIKMLNDDSSDITSEWGL